MKKTNQRDSLEKEDKRYVLSRYSWELFLKSFFDLPK
jgi:hypothetical protein